MDGSRGNILPAALDEGTEGGDGLDLLRLFALVLAEGGHLDGQQVGEVVNGQGEPILGHQGGQSGDGGGAVLLALDEGDIGQIGVIAGLLEFLSGHGAGGGAGGGGGVLLGHGDTLLLFVGAGGGVGGGVDAGGGVLLGHSDTPFICRIVCFGSCLVSLRTFTVETDSPCPSYDMGKSEHIAEYTETGPKSKQR